MFDDRLQSTDIANPPRDLFQRARQESKSQTASDELFYGATPPPHALDSTGCDRCRPAVLVLLVAAAVLSASLTAYIGMYGLPGRSPVVAPATSDSSHAHFGPLRQ